MAMALIECVCATFTPTFFHTRFPSTSFCHNPNLPSLPYNPNRHLSRPQCSPYPPLIHPTFTFFCEAHMRSPAAQRRRTEQLWRHLLANPSEWWDHRLDKATVSYPDFKHRQTQEPLWIQNPSTPDWVLSELSCMSPGAIQQSVFSWNLRLEKLVKNGQYRKGIEYFHQMEAEGVSMDTFTFVSVLNACAHVKDLDEGRRIHAKIIQSRCHSHVFVGNGLINMYAKCGCILEARRVFNKMAACDATSWNAMIMGYAKCGEGLKALELFHQMITEGMEPNTITFVGSLNACASLAALDQGRLIHEHLRQLGLEKDPFLECCLIDMYTKCGSISEARRVFDGVTLKGVVSWNAMILGYALHGPSREALRLFDLMCSEGGEINSSTFVSLFTACNHWGLVDEAEYCLGSMGAIYGIQPNVEHFSSLVDLLGRCGYLDLAENMVDTMWCKPDHRLWMTLLSACSNPGNMTLGEKAAKQLLKLDPENSAAYVVLSNVYAASHIKN